MPFPAAAAIAQELAAIPTLEDRVAKLAASVDGRKSLATALGKEAQCILHAIMETKADIDVFTLDTGRLFPETLDTIEATERRYGIKMRVVAPDPLEIERLVRRDGISGFRTSLDARQSCCNVRKVRPLQRALQGAAAWITGLRRGQSAIRAAVPFAEYDHGHGMLKINPLADWNQEQVDAYIALHAIPVNPLHARGFPSIGCHPCTRAIRPGEDMRAGRWWWENEEGKECGLHAPRKAAAAA